MNYYIQHIALLFGVQFWILTGLGQTGFYNLKEAYQCEDRSRVIYIKFFLHDEENYALLQDSSTYSIADFPNLKSFTTGGYKNVGDKQYIERWLLGIPKLNNLNKLYVNSDIVLKDIGKVTNLSIRLISTDGNKITVLDSLEKNRVKKVHFETNYSYRSDQVSVDLMGLDSLEILSFRSNSVKKFVYSYDTNQNKLRELKFWSDSLERVTAEGPPLGLYSIYLHSKSMSNLGSLDINTSDLFYLGVDAPIETLGNSSILTTKGIVEVDFSNSRFTSIPTDIFSIKSLREFRADFASLDAIDLDGLDVEPMLDLDVFYVIINPYNYSKQEIYGVKNETKKKRRDSRKLAKKISFEDALVIKVKKIKKKK